MATAAITAERENYLNQEYGIKSWLLTVDHKRIALLYLMSITFFFFIGGFFALLIRLELLTPAGDLVQADTYNKLFTMHGQVMVFFFLIPSIPAVLGNFLVPLMIGAKDLAFPRINLLSWYLYIIAGILMLHCMLTGGVDTGWTFYTPFSTAFSNTKVIEAGLAIFISGFSSILTGLNFVVTIHRMRAPGMTWNRLPLFIWAHYATSIIQLLGTPVIAVTLVLVVLERALHLGIFDPTRGGDPLLFQHLFWFYSHPAVYIMILPSMGVVTEIVPCFTRKRIFGYKFVAMSSIGIAVFGFLVWAHHMFVAGISLYSALIFSAAQLPGCGSFRHQGLQLDRHHVQGLDHVFHAHAVRLRLHRPVSDGRPYRFVPGRAGHRRARDRHLLRRRPLPLHHGRRRGDGLSWRDAFLVAENFRTHVSGSAGPAGGGDRIPRLQPDVLPPVHPGLPRDAAPLLAVSAGISGAERALDRRRPPFSRLGTFLPMVYFLWSMRYGKDCARQSLGSFRPGVDDHFAAADTYNFDRTPVVDWEAYDYENIPAPQEARVAG